MFAPSIKSHVPEGRTSVLIIVTAQCLAWEDAWHSIIVQLRVKCPGVSSKENFQKCFQF